VLQQEKGLRLPRPLQIDFSGVVQEIADRTSRELTTADIWTAFQETYLQENGRLALIDYDSTAPRRPGQERSFVGRLHVDGKERSISGRGNGLISSLLAALREDCGLELEVIDYHEHALGRGSDAKAACYLECQTTEGRTVWGVGINSDISTASVKAVLGAANQILSEAR